MENEDGQSTNTNMPDYDEKQMLSRVPKTIANAVWFKKWTQSIDGISQQTTIAQVLSRLSVYFQKNYQVSLENDFAQKSALEDFLTVKKSGHCEYFASAAALYLRSLGIPSRIVAGYRGGEFNVVTQLLETEERQAHAWLEFWMPGSGWIAYDPTPMRFTPTSPGTFSGFKHYLSAINFWFYRYVIDFNAETQKDMAEKIVSVDFSKLWRFESLSFDNTIMELSILSLSSIGMIWVLYRVLRRKDELRFLPKFYTALVLRLKNYGYERTASETFRSYHLRLIHSGFDETAVSAFDQALEDQIYAKKKIPKSQLQHLRKSLRYIKRPKTTKGHK